MSTADSRVQAILEAGDDPFMLLNLPGPELDALDRPKWDVEDSTITRQYRRLSLCCHPDKNQTEDAARAFHRLGRARDQLLNRDERTKLLQAMTAELLQKRSRKWTSGLSATHEMTKSRERREEAKRLREEEARRQAALIRMHADERRARLERNAAARHRGAAEAAEGDGSSTGGNSDSRCSRKRPRMHKAQYVDDGVDGDASGSTIGSTAADKREPSGADDIPTARGRDASVDDQRTASRQTGVGGAARSDPTNSGHRYDESDDTSDSDAEALTAAAKARARRKAAGRKRRARSAMFI